MLAANGYVKLVDFGFAKQIGYSTKTWTFCGTPGAGEVGVCSSPNFHNKKVLSFFRVRCTGNYLEQGSRQSSGLLGDGSSYKRTNYRLSSLHRRRPFKDLQHYLEGDRRNRLSTTRLDCCYQPSEEALPWLSSWQTRFTAMRNWGNSKAQVGERQSFAVIGQLLLTLRFFSRWFQGFDWESLSNLTLEPPKITFVNGPLDLSNFDSFPNDFEVPPDENSGWDEGF